MLFELRDHTPDVTAPWTEVRDLFLDGKTRDAAAIANAGKGKVALSTANDYLLNIELARALSCAGADREETVPGPTLRTVYYSRMLQTRRRHLTADSPAFGP